MTESISFGELDFKLVSSMTPVRETPTDDTPFRIAVLGDFSGRQNRGLPPSQGSSFKGRFHMVDRDNIENLMERLTPKLHLKLSGTDADAVQITLKFNELDDFHPDQLFQQATVFKALKDKRRQLKDPKTFAASAATLKPAEIDSESPDTRAAQPHPDAPPISTSGSLLDQIIDAAPQESRHDQAPAAQTDWDRFLQNIVAPHILPGNDKEQEQLIAALDASISTVMRQILHHPDFQTLEASWRALKFLVYRLESDTHLQVYLCDVSKAELLADMTSGDTLNQTQTYKILVSNTVETPGADPWSLIVGNYTFNPSLESVQFLARMAPIAQLAGAPFVAAGHPYALGCHSLAATPDPNDWREPLADEMRQVWQALQALPESSYIGLALPRFLLRLPYGEDTDPTDYFEFEEIGPDFEHHHYLWGNPAIVCALLMGQTFSQYGWAFDQGNLRNITGLPLHTTTQDNTVYNKPCAEALLTQNAVEKIIDKGYMVLISYKNQDQIRLPRFQSIAATPTLLAGRWRF